MTKGQLLTIGCLILVIGSPLRTPASAAPAQSAPYSLSFATFFGGSGWERAQGVDVDAAGYIYITGNTSSSNLPTTPGAFQRNYAGDSGGGTTGGDAYVAKFSPDGKNLIWCTYLGGPDGDRGYGIKVDGAGYVYVASWAGPGFPTTPGAYDTTHNSPGVFDVAFTKIKPDGSGLEWSTYVGGSGMEQGRDSMAVDSSGAVYASGWTDSPNFPTTPGAFQRTLNGPTDAYVIKLKPDGSGLEFATLYGGSGDENAFTNVGVHTDGTVYTAGQSNSADMPVTSGAVQPTKRGPAGEYDAFVARFNATGSGLVFATYLGGSGFDSVAANDGFTIDSAGRPIIPGYTESVDFPTTSGAVQPNFGGGSGGDEYVAILSADGSQLVASTYLGGSMHEDPGGIRIDATGEIYVGGRTWSANFPVTAGAFQTALQGTSDAYWAKLSPDLTQLRYATFLGGSGGDDRIRSLDLAPGGNVVLAGITDSGNYPVTAGSYDTTHNGAGDSHITVFSPASAPSPGTLQFSASNFSVAENAGTAVVTVTRSGGSSGSVSVEYSTANGNAVAGSDYLAASGTLTWNNGDTADKTFSVTLLDDPNQEPDETVLLALQNPGGGAALGTPAGATLTITNDDTGPDSDGDGLPDSWELTYFPDLGQGPGGDPDTDGLTNIDEFNAGTDPTNPDTDGDGLTDGDEVNLHGTNPLATDTDADGMTDDFEVNQGFDPLNPDQDGNGVLDGQDDWDGDGVINQNDPTPGVPPVAGGGGGSGGSGCGATGVESVLLLVLLGLFPRRRF